MKMNDLIFGNNVSGPITAFFLLFGFIILTITEPVLIPILIRLKFGQEIREIGPNWHKSKSGTPTMGGVAFIICTLLLLVIDVFFFYDKKIVYLLSFILAYGLIGFIDDFIKVVLKRNLGLTSLQKFLFQLLAAIVFVFIGVFSKMLDSVVFIPFIGDVNFGIYYIPFAIFIILALVNSVNLTDGLDGLAARVTAIVFLFFVFVSCYFLNGYAAVVSAVFLGATMGFLLFNKHPAKVFMGDTGSLLLGSVVVLLAMESKMEVILILAGGIYLIETLSVILQVASFKLRGKRIFKMSPLHHHFEMCGWKETKVVKVFSLITLGLCALAFVLVMTP